MKRTINTPHRLGLPNLGFGVGLRPQHIPEIINNGPRVDWFEIISENFIGNDGFSKQIIRNLAHRIPLVMHGVSLSVGSTEPLNKIYLNKLKELARQINASWVSDHLCWTNYGGYNSHDLLPLPLNEETLHHVAHRIIEVQDFMERPLIIENPSSYIQYKSSTINEWDFLSQLVELTGCGLLLDVNNVYVSAYNHRFDDEHYIRSLPHDSIVQIHLAGPSYFGEYLIDTHDTPVPARVWELYALAQQLTGGVSTLLEWDARIPTYPELLAELDKARLVMAGKKPEAPESPLYSHGETPLSSPLDFQLNPTRQTIALQNVKK